MKQPEWTRWVNASEREMEISLVLKDGQEKKDITRLEMEGKKNLSKNGEACLKYCSRLS